MAIVGRLPRTRTETAKETKNEMVGEGNRHKLTNSAAPQPQVEVDTTQVKVEYIGWRKSN